MHQNPGVPERIQASELFGAVRTPSLESLGLLVERADGFRIHPDVVLEFDFRACDSVSNS